MAVDFTWVDPDKRVAHYTFVGKWTWEELYDAFRASWDEMSQLDHMVDSISDFTQARGIPPSAMTHVRMLTQNRPPNTGVMIVVGASTYVTMMMQTFRQVYQTTLKRDMDVLFAKTMDEAYATLAEKQTERGA
jgi:hypothetical protein